MPARRSVAIVAVTLAGLVAISLFLAPSPAQAVEGERPNSLDGGAWALQFRVGENFTFESFTGSTISIKRHFSPSTALRFGVSPSLASAENDFLTTVTETSEAERDDSNNQVVLNLHLVHYPWAGRTVNLYVGAGPEVGWSYFESRSRDETLTDRTTSQVFRVGLGALVGVEWFASPWLGLHAEYGTVFSRTSSQRFHDVTPTNPGFIPFHDETRSSVWALGGRGAALGASVYF